MRAVVIESGELSLLDRPQPQPGKGELLVRTYAAGLNAADLLQRRGLYPAPPGSPPDIPGLEVAGSVERVGDGVGRFKAGDAVMAVVGGGAQAEFVVVHESAALPVPPTVRLVDAGGFAEAFTTAHDALFTQCGLGPGERLLVNGAAGGVGVAAIQLAATAGATVTASVRNAELRAAVAELGAVAIDPADTAAGGPYDVVLELVGAPNLSLDIECLAPGGRLSIIGVGAGARAEINLLAVMARRLRLHGSTLRSRSLEDKATAARLVERHVLPLLATGRIRVPVAASYPAEDVVAAYGRLEAGGKLGKVVLTFAV